MRYALCLLVLLPGTVFANSCGTRVVVVNHRDHAVTVSMKSFYADHRLPAPAPDDLDEPPRSDGIPPYFSHRQRVEVPAGGSVEVPFRRLCTGDFWLNWRADGADGEARASGQLWPHYGQSIDIR